MEGDRLISTQEAAEILGVSPDGVLWLVRQGRLTPATLIRPRQTTFFRLSDAERLAAERRREGSRARHVPSRKDPSPPKTREG